MKRILPIIVVSQFFCTSMWFAGNAIIGDIAKQMDIAPDYLGHLSSAIQFGFISGTLLFALLSVADRFSSSKVFFASAVIAALFNLAISSDGNNPTTLLVFRFLTGFFLAGIYPVGMKIASDWYQQGLGKSLGFLVGALVLGTAFPHLLKSMTISFPWKYVVYATSILSVAGGTAMLWLVPDGPYRKPGQQPSLFAFVKGFKNPNFRAAALGYFGHMWELYTLWVFVPVILTAYKSYYPDATFNIPFLSFLIIASGGVSCMISGSISQRFGTKRVATAALFISCVCCLLSPLFLFIPSTALFILFLLIWGMSVTADSPLFSTIVAHNAPAQSKGASLTIVNCIGFSITIVSIQLLNILVNENNAGYIYMILAAGPILGLIALISRRTPERPA